MARKAHKAFIAVAAVVTNVAAEEARVDMHKLVGIECGQVRLAASHVDWAQELAGLEEGSCESLGFTESRGTREVSIPLVGQLGLGIFRKPDVLGIAQQVSEQLNGKPASRGSACCETCGEGQEKYVSESDASCQEACLSLAMRMGLSFSGLLDPSFQPANGRGCLERQFPVLNATLMKGVEPASFSWDVYSRQPANTVTLRKVAFGVCGELALSNSEAETSLKLPIGLETGTCVSAGYAESAGQQEIPGLPGKELALFRKAGDLDVLDGLHMVFAAITQDTVKMFKVVGSLCSEASVDRKFQTSLQNFGQFELGSCQEHGYSIAAGSQSFSIPLLAEVQLALYHKGIPGMNFVV
ncbi:unnamed protein product [Symbiodinium pilosum]|uniref:Uncharacterized protein n=1 Tax=Symbiodinium pilosum TaxID=2952 RepID=A0A812P4L0_SYMPI|nr:unnamed protein product [Symbiodinium pilosum]